MIVLITLLGKKVGIAWQAIPFKGEVYDEKMLFYCSCLFLSDYLGEALFLPWLYNSKSFCLK